MLDSSDSVTIRLYDKSFDTILPWVGARARLLETDSRKANEYCYADGADVPAFPDGDATGAITLRLLEVSEGDPCCVLEMDFGNEMFDLDLIGRACGARMIKLRWVAAEGQLQLAEFTVQRVDQLERYLSISLKDFESGQARWSFETHGTPLSWEDTETYSQRSVMDRLPFALLTRYLGQFGFDYEAFQKRRFSRAVEFGYRRDGPNLESYDLHAEQLRHSDEAFHSELTRFFETGSRD